jgi:hypothetical protein
VRLADIQRPRRVADPHKELLNATFREVGGLARQWHPDHAHLPVVYYRERNVQMGACCCTEPVRQHLSKELLVAVDVRPGC